MTWKEGRNLSSVIKGGQTTSYLYDRDGIRVKKTNPDGSYINFYVVDSRTVGEIRYQANGSKKEDIRYVFDETGSVCGFDHWPAGATAWVHYYFVKNLQGDVLAVYRASDNAKVAEYTYDSVSVKPPRGLHCRAAA